MAPTLTSSALPEAPTLYSWSALAYSLSPPFSIFASSSACSLSSAVRRSSAFTTICRAVISSLAATSCSTSRMSIPGGMPAAICSLPPRPMAVISVDLPQPLGPTKPYRRPWARDSLQSEKSVFPPSWMVKRCTYTSSLPSRATCAIAVVDRRWQAVNREKRARGLCWRARARGERRAAERS